MKSIEKAKKELSYLINSGDLLYKSMLLETGGKEFKEALNKTYSEDEVKRIIKSLPDFEKTYQSWYSESLAVIKQLLPDRVSDFTKLYEAGKSRKEIDFENYVIADYLVGLEVTRGVAVIVNSKAAIPKFMQQVAILEAAKRRFESSLFELRQIVQADLFDSEIEAAKELHKNKFATIP